MKRRTFTATAAAPLLAPAVASAQTAPTKMLVLTGITLAFWMPSMLRGAGVKDTVQIGWMVATPYVLATIGMLLLGRTSDASGERRWHTALPGIMAAAGLAVMPWTLHDPGLLLAASTVAIAGNVAERLDLRESLTLSTIGCIVFIVGWLLQQSARPK